MYVPHSPRHPFPLPTPLAHTLQVISWWGPTWREGTHDTQGVNTDAVLGLVVRELEQQDSLKLAFHMEPYEGETGDTPHTSDIWAVPTILHPAVTIVSRMLRPLC